MSFKRDLEVVLFSFGFSACKKKKGLNFLKLTNNEYLLIRIFEKVETADLFHAKFDTGNPCDSEPYWEKTLKLGFSPDSDIHILRNYIEQFK